MYVNAKGDSPPSYMSCVYVCRSVEELSRRVHRFRASREPERSAEPLNLVSVGVAMSRNFLLVCRVFIVIDQASRYNYKDEVCVGTGSAGH